jgi:uncharacterized protein (UPF0371 family)
MKKAKNIDNVIDSSVKHIIKELEQLYETKIVYTNMYGYFFKDLDAVPIIDDTREEQKIIDLCDILDQLRIIRLD